MNISLINRDKIFRGSIKIVKEELSKLGFELTLSDQILLKNHYVHPIATSLKNIEDPLEICGYDPAHEVASWFLADNYGKAL